MKLVGEGLAVNIVELVGEGLAVNITIAVCITAVDHEFTVTGN